MKRASANVFHEKGFKGKNSDDICIQWNPVANALVCMSFFEEITI